jgi:predicted Zn-dependent protease
MKRQINASLAVLALAFAATGLPGCATVPATGESAFTGGLSTAKEIRIGRENHPKIIKEFGGEYGSPELRRYVASIGQLLARTVERQDLEYKFTVLNSDIVNAFATPGGYVYITRGLMALADDEAELAGVLAHELGHLTALHHAKRYGKGMLANILLTGAAIVTGQVAPQARGGIMQAGQSFAVGLLQGFSRENEFESDDLGVRYLARVGYDPGAMAGFLRKLRAHSRLSARLRGEAPDKVDQFNYLATHPAPIERVRRAEAKARATRVRAPMTARDVYFGKIDGMLYGGDPKQGFVRGRVFLHPDLRFRFEVPKGFRLFNSPKAVVAFGPKGSRIIFDQAPKPSDGKLTSYLTDVWARGASLTDVEKISINGLEAATGLTRLRAKQGVLDVRLLAIRVDLKTIYRFLFLTPGELTRTLARDLRRTIYSFRQLDEPEAMSLRPRRIDIIRVAPGDTVASLARRMPFEDFAVERFRVLNGLAADTRPATGRRVKIVVE